MGKHFDRVIGTDPSPGMIRQSRESIAGRPEFKYVEFREGAAEDGSLFLKDGEVDMVVAGQAAHWFDYARFWPEMRRIVRKEGTIAVWGYKDHVFVDFPEATRIMQSYAYDQDADKLGSYWPMPGRSYVQDKLRVIKPPQEDWDDVRRVEYEPDTRGRRSGQGEVMMERRLSVAECKKYVRTWSSFHGWQVAHPEMQAREQGGKGDIMDEMFDEIAQGTEYFRNEDNEVNIEWGSGIVMARRKA